MTKDSEVLSGLSFKEIGPDDTVLQELLEGILTEGLTDVLASDVAERERVANQIQAIKMGYRTGVLAGTTSAAGTFTTQGGYLRDSTSIQTQLITRAERLPIQLKKKSEAELSQGLLVEEDEIVEITDHESTTTQMLRDAEEDGVLMDWIAVREGYRGKGVGRAMVEHEIALAHREGKALVVESDVGDVTPFYEKLMLHVSTHSIQAPASGEPGEEDTESMEDDSTRYFVAFPALKSEDLGRRTGCALRSCAYHTETERSTGRKAGSD